MCVSECVCVCVRERECECVHVSIPCLNRLTSRCSWGQRRLTRSQSISLCAALMYTLLSLLSPPPPPLPFLSPSPTKTIPLSFPTLTSKDKTLEGCVRAPCYGMRVCVNTCVCECVCVYVCFTRLCWFTVLFALCWTFYEGW